MGILQNLAEAEENSISERLYNLELAKQMDTSF